MTKFPVTLRHPKTGGITTADTPSSLRVLEARGWRPQRSSPAPDTPRTPPVLKPDDDTASTSGEEPRSTTTRSS